MTPNETARLAAAIAIIRPDWLVDSLQTLLAAHADKPFRDVAIAATWVAVDPNTDTPGRLNMAGPWWHATARDERPREVKNPGPRPAYLQVRCPDVPGDCRRAAGAPCASCRQELAEISA